MNGILCLADYSVNHREIKPISELGTSTIGCTSFEQELEGIKEEFKKGLKKYPLSKGLAMFSYLFIDRKDYVGTLTKQNIGRGDKARTAFFVGEHKFLDINERINTMRELGIKTANLEVTDLDTGSSNSFKFDYLDSADLGKLLNSALDFYVGKMINITIVASLDSIPNRKLRTETFYDIVSISLKDKSTNTLSSFTDFETALNALTSDVYVSELKRGISDGLTIVPQYSFGRLTVGVLTFFERKINTKTKDTDSLIIAQGSKSKVGVSRYLNKNFLNRMVTIEVTSLEDDKVLTLSGVVDRLVGVTYVGGKPLHESLSSFKDKKVIVNIK